MQYSQTSKSLRFYPARYVTQYNKIQICWKLREGTTIRTPEEFKKKIRQRVHSVHIGKAKLPRTPRYRFFVIRRLVKRTVNSPTTGCTMKPLLHNVYCSPHKHRNRYASILQGTLRNIIKHKIRGNLIQFKKKVDKFKSKVSVREGARILNMHYKFYSSKIVDHTVRGRTCFVVGVVPVFFISVINVYLSFVNLLCSTHAKNE